MTAGQDKAKALLRAEIRERRHGLQPAWIADTSRVVQERALSLPECAGASVVGCYVALRGEVATDLIIESSGRNGKTVCVPAFDRESDTYRLTRLCAASALVAGPMGVPEPVGGEPIAAADVDCVVVPGLAFDAFGGRLGHGGGHYDRMLAEIPRRATKIGLAFAFQIYDRVPVSGHDIPMDIVVSEDRTLDCARGALENKEGQTCKDW